MTRGDMGLPKQPAGYRLETQRDYLRRSPPLSESVRHSTGVFDANIGRRHTLVTSSTGMRRRCIMRSEYTPHTRRLMSEWLANRIENTIARKPCFLLFAMFAVFFAMPRVFSNIFYKCRIFQSKFHFPTFKCEDYKPVLILLNYWQTDLL
jgi:hypothetical protein